MRHMLHFNVQQNNVQYYNNGLVPYRYMLACGVRRCASRARSALMGVVSMVGGHRSVTWRASARVLLLQSSPGNAGVLSFTSRSYNCSHVIYPSTHAYATTSQTGNPSYLVIVSYLYRFTAYQTQISPFIKVM